MNNKEILENIINNENLEEFVIIKKENIKIINEKKIKLLEEKMNTIHNKVKKYINYFFIFYTIISIALIVLLLFYPSFIVILAWGLLTFIGVYITNFLISKKRKDFKTYLKENNFSNHLDLVKDTFYSLIAKKIETDLKILEYSSAIKGFLVSSFLGSIYQVYLKKSSLGFIERIKEEFYLPVFWFSLIIFITTIIIKFYFKKKKVITQPFFDSIIEKLKNDTTEK